MLNFIFTIKNYICTKKRFYSIMMTKIRTNTRTVIPYKWELIILLWFAFFFNQADRQIFNVVLPSMRNELNLTDADMGLVATILTLFYGVLVPFAGFLGDRVNKKYILMASLLFWSGATLLTGLSTTLIHLVLLRSIATGGGEAFYAPPANALISEYHEKTRATAMSIHQTAIYAGIISSGFLAGYLADLFGWRIAFYSFGGFGIILGIIFYFRVKDSKPAIDSAQNAKGMPVLKVLSIILKKPTAILLTIAFAGMVFVNVGFMTWMPTFLHEKFGFSLARSGFDSTFYHYIAAFIGVMVGARFADKHITKHPRIRGIVQMAGLAFGAPFIFYMSKGNSIWVIYIALTGFGLFRGIYDSNIFAALYDVIEKPFRSTATGLMLMFAFVAGAAAPYILGVLKPTLGLANGLSSLAFVYIFSSICIMIAVLFFYKKDIVK